MTQNIKITIIPDSTTPSKEISIPKKWLFSVFFTVLVMGTAGFYLLFSGILWEKKEDANFRKKLARENFEVTQKILKIKKSSSNLESQVSDLNNEKDEILKLSWNQEPQRKGASNVPWYNPKKLQPTEINMDSIQAQVIKLAAFFDTIYSLMAQFREKTISLPISWPVAKSSFIIRGFGQAIDPFSARKTFHAGVDFAGTPGDPVYSAGNGIIKSLETSPFHGKMIRIRHLKNIETVYTHLKSFKIKKGQNVKRGQQIGSIGNTGMATGPHLHFEVIVDGEKIDPESIFLEERKKTEDLAYGSK